VFEKNTPPSDLLQPQTVTRAHLPVPAAGHGFGAAALFVFLVLAAQYESWNLPLAVVMIVPMCLLASVTGLLWRGMAIDVLAQIGFVVLVGLAAKNAILIVEFARQTTEAGATPGEAAVTAARTRLRPILTVSHHVRRSGACIRRRSRAGSGAWPVGKCASATACGRRSLRLRGVQRLDEKLRPF
jgi:hypothetical protein